jgi:hypothetical protein
LAAGAAAAAGGTDAGAGSGTGAGSGSGSDAGSGADAGAGSDAAAGDADSMVNIIPVVGGPQLSGAKPSVKFFALKKGMAATVETSDLSVGGRAAVEFTSDMYIDHNGARDWSKKDKAGRATTERYPDGKSLNPRTIPFIVIPPNFLKDYPDVKMGDYAAVSYGGKTVYAIVGDLGPRGVIGAGSIALARSLGIDPDRKGGIGGGVTYVILAGSADPTPPADAAQIEETGAQLFDASGIPIQ